MPIRPAHLERAVRLHRSAGGQQRAESPVLWSTGETLTFTLAIATGGKAPPSTTSATRHT